MGKHVCDRPASDAFVLEQETKCQLPALESLINHLALLILIALCSHGGAARREGALHSSTQHLVRDNCAVREAGSQHRGL